MHLLNREQRRSYAVKDKQDPGHESDHLWFWVEVHEPKKRNNSWEDQLAYRQLSASRLEHFLETFGPQLLGCQTDCFVFRGKRCDEGSKSYRVFTRETWFDGDHRRESLVSILRVPTSRLLFPKDLKPLGVKAQPGMLYMRIPYRQKDPCTGIFSQPGLFDIQERQKRVVMTRAEKPKEKKQDDYSEVRFFGSHFSDFHATYPFEGRLPRELPDQALAFFRPETNCAIPLGAVPLYDLECCYNVSFLPGVSLPDNELLVEMPLVYSGGVLTQLRSALRAAMVAVYGEHNSSVNDLVQSLFLGGQKIPMVKGSLRASDAKASEWNLRLPEMKLPVRSPPDLHWMGSENWEIVQLLLLAFLADGNSWLDALSNLQVQADLEMPWSTLA